MVIETKRLQKCCSMLKEAEDAESAVCNNTCLILHGADGLLTMSISNLGFSLSVSAPVEASKDTMEAIVDAPLFIGLVSKTTSQEISLSCQENSLLMNGNGSYHLPFMYQGHWEDRSALLKLGTVSESFEADSPVLSSIARYNSGELLKGGISRAVQSMHYIDREGVITFASGACVNDFSLGTDTSVLVPDNIVRLFDLFGTEGKATVSYGKSVSGGKAQTAIGIDNGEVRLVAIVPDDSSMKAMVPVKQIRDMARLPYRYNVNIRIDDFMQSCNRLLFINKGSNSSDRTHGTITFGAIGGSLSDFCGTNRENIAYCESSLPAGTEEKVVIDLRFIVQTMKLYDSRTTARLSYNPQDNHMLLSQGNIHNVIPVIEG